MAETMGSCMVTLMLMTDVLAADSTLTLEASAPAMPLSAGVSLNASGFCGSPDLSELLKRLMIPPIARPGSEVM